MDEAFRWGIYEKALAPGPWPRMFEDAASAGYQFLEISIDESDERLGRLDWPLRERKALHSALAEGPVSIDTMCLSGHRRFALGSASGEQRSKALDIMRKAIDFAAEFGLRIVQVAGYDVHYEASTDRTRALFMESILRSAQWARESCVMLAVENVECPEVDSIEKALRLVRAADTPWFQLYPDIGNLTAMGKDVSRELELGGRNIVGLHLKDAREREFRRVPFGEGIVDFDGAFRTLARLGYRGSFMVEMWNEAEGDPRAAAGKAREWLGRKVRSAFSASP
jgi:L-ribulose-5-phosphate 3-epimerase